MQPKSQKPKFGTLSAVTLFFVVLLLPLILGIWLFSSSPASSLLDTGDFSGLLLIPIVFVLGLAGLVFAIVATKKYRISTPSANYSIKPVVPILIVMLLILMILICAVVVAASLGLL
jgi:hypothetical protein